jgi:predicted metal-binding protein
MKDELITMFYGSRDHGSFLTNDPKSDSFWAFYRDICRQMADIDLLRTHRDVVDLVKYVRAGLSKADVREKLVEKARLLKQQFSVDDLDTCIDFAGRLVTMICWQDFTFRLNEGQYHWLDADSLADTVATVVNKQNGTNATTSKATNELKIKFEKSFTAMSLVRIAGFEIVWTWNVMDHLKVSEDDKQVHIFGCMACLRWQLDEYVGLRIHSRMPD